MSVIDYFFGGSYDWFYGNWQRLSFCVIGIVVAYAVYELLSKELAELKEKQKLEENVAINLNRVFR
jgi:hypothetical protein